MKAASVKAGACGMVSVMSIRPSAYEFFAGGGLAGMGLSQGQRWGRGLAGIDTVFANDMDGMKAAAFRANHADTP